MLFGMSKLSKAVSIHPYFKIHPGKEDEFKAIIKQFVKQTESEDYCLYYDFSIGGGQAFCREAYEDAEGLLKHLGNVNTQLGEALEISNIVRIEVHGPADELEKLKQPLAELPVNYYTHVAGLKRG